MKGTHGVWAGRRSCQLIAVGFARGERLAFCFVPFIGELKESFDCYSF